MLLVQQQTGEVVGGSCQGGKQHSEGVPMPRHGRYRERSRTAVGALVELGRVGKIAGVANDKTTNTEAPVVRLAHA